MTFSGSSARLCGVLFLILTAISCGRDEDVEGPPFPNAIGNTWSYAFTDSLHGVTDTVHVSIVGFTTILEHTPGYYPYFDGGPVFIWEFRSAAEIDSCFVHVAGDTVTLVRGLSSASRDHVLFQGISRLVFPLAPGDAWENTPRDGTHVAERSWITTASGRFRAWRLERSWAGNNARANVTMWLAPGVGVVRQHVRVRVFFQLTAVESWELIAYEVAGIP